MEFTLTKEQEAIAHSAAKDSMRPVLANVCLRNGELIAADGFILAKTKVSGEFTTENDTLIPSRDILRAKQGKNPLRISGNGDNKVEICDKDGVILSEMQPGNFPKVDNLYPTEQSVFAIRISKEVLSTMLKMMVGNSDCIDFTFYSDKSAIAYKIFNRYHDKEDATISGIAMPMCRN